MKNPNVTKWLDNQHYKDFKRQIVTDIFVAKRNKVSNEDINSAIKELSNEIFKDISKLN